ncbi:MAG: TolC family protein [Gemmatimonadaceae bacterium]
MTERTIQIPRVVCTIPAPVFLVALAALLSLTARIASGQLPLADALLTADRAGFANRAAAGTRTAQHGAALGALRGILPSVRFDAGYVRTTDPIGTFGATLRQRAATAADFDPARLNHPDAVGNYGTAVVVEQPLFNADAWTGRRAASRAEDAAAETQQWTTLSTRAGVVRAYYGAVLAAERATTLGAALTAARAHVRDAESLVRNGSATKSDALLATVRADDIESQLLDASGNSTNALRQLEIALGQEPTGNIVLPRELPGSAAIRQAASGDTAREAATQRGDVEAAQSVLDASRADVTRAHSAYVPRVNGFARYDWNSAATLYGGDKNWTVGVMASWAPFAGASEIADAETAAGHAAAARAGADGAIAKAKLELETTRVALGVALARLDIAEHAAAQSGEAHRMVARKYDAGLASIAELLDAHAVQVQSALALSQSRFAVIAASAERKLALGRDPGALAVLDGSSPTVGGNTSRTEPEQRR